MHFTTGYIEYYFWDLKPPTQTKIVVWYGTTLGTNHTAQFAIIPAGIPAGYLYFTIM